MLLKNLDSVINEIPLEADLNITLVIMREGLLTL